MPASNPSVSDAPVVIVGAGLAGAKTAEALRAHGYTGPVVLVGTERHLPYERPPLSKEFLAGTKTQDEFTVHDRAWYDDNDVELRLGVTATALDTSRRTVDLDDGTTLSYSSLVLASGSRALTPPIDGADATGVHTLRTLDDAASLRDALTEGTRLAVVGGGWIGLEVAAGARGRGAQVTVIEASEQPLRAALGSELGAVFAGLHREHGVDLRLGARVEAITSSGGAATGVRLTDGTHIDADVVLIAVGARPDTDLAESAGIATENGGVRVDSALRSSAPDVYAVGDLASAEHSLYRTRVRIEHWANALNQPDVAAAGICGESAVYDRLPYFFTDQYDLGMEFTGRATGYTRVVFRGDVIGRRFLAFWLDGSDRVLAGMNVNIWDQGDAITSLVAGRTPVDPDALADASVPPASARR